MLKLVDLIKDYKVGTGYLRALKGINLQFRDSEFVSILGHSGCGKTTMLNIIGGLDRYTSGDLFIDGVSTKQFKDVDWDSYRNIKIGFIFQSYNLISHISILENVEMALTLSGVSRDERRKRAKKALEEVGLGDHINKKPNQLSGGQMQRVSIARALINNPQIILADEPTGALDNKTSIQIMELLKEISANRLIIMVTHNAELAEQYSSRIIRLDDGEVVDDTMPYNEEMPQVEIIADEKQKKQEHRNKKRALKKTSMSLFTAMNLSLKNLLTKKGRTTMTSIAGSIGIIGVALVLAISNGMSTYITNMQRTVLAGYPIQIAKENIDMNKVMEMIMGTGTSGGSKENFPNIGGVLPYDPMENIVDLIMPNNITKEYVDYVKELNSKGLVSNIKYQYGLDMNIVGKINTSYSGYDDPYGKVAQVSSSLSQMAGMVGGGLGETTSPNINMQQLSSKETTLEGYDLLAGTYPQEKNEMILIVDKNNQVNKSILASLNQKYNSSKIDFDKLIGNNSPIMRAIPNDYLYTYDEEAGYYKTNDYEKLYNGALQEGMVELKIVGVLRQKEDNLTSTLSAGIGYLEDLELYMLQQNMTSQIVESQKNNNKTNVLTGKDFPGILEAEALFVNKGSVLQSLGGIDIPSIINVYPKDFKAKEQILTYLDAYNDQFSLSINKIQYNDMSKFATDIMSQTINIITIALACFASVSLVVSSVMIGIITYVSVVERTKEIGILRSLGARKIDIMHVFNMETALIGLFAGLIGVIFTYILSIPINMIIVAKVAVDGLCALSPLHAIMLIVISMALTIIAGLIPSVMASKKDPVIALRTE